MKAPYKNSAKILTAAAVGFFFFMVARHGDLGVGRTHAQQRTTIAFPHELHVEKQISCDSCHDGEPAGGYGTQDAVHMKCLGCHREIEKQGKKTGPRLCGQCHPWK